MLIAARWREFVMSNPHEELFETARRRVLKQQAAAAVDDDEVAAALEDMDEQPSTPERKKPGPKPKGTPGPKPKGKKVEPLKIKISKKKKKRKGGSVSYFVIHLQSMRNKSQNDSPTNKAFSMWAHVNVKLFH